MEEVNSPGEGAIRQGAVFGVRAIAAKSNYFTCYEEVSILRRKNRSIGFISC